VQTNDGRLNDLQGLFFFPQLDMLSSKLIILFRSTMKNDFMAIDSDRERGDMHISLPLLLLALAVVLIGGVALILLPARQARRAGHTMRRIADHGAHIASKYGLARSPEWHRVAREHRLREPACVACGYKGKHLQVHHIKPFHLHPHLELDPQNLITLCEARGREHHLLLGHLDAWNSYNEHVRADAKHFHRKSAAQIRSDLHWQKKMQQRP